MYGNVWGGGDLTTRKTGHIRTHSLELAGHYINLLVIQKFTPHCKY